MNRDNKIIIFTTKQVYLPGSKNGIKHLFNSDNTESYFGLNLCSILSKYGRIKVDDTGELLKFYDSLSFIEETQKKHKNKFGINLVKVSSISATLKIIIADVIKDEKHLQKNKEVLEKYLSFCMFYKQKDSNIFAFVSPDQKMDGLLDSLFKDIFKIVKFDELQKPELTFVLHKTDIGINNLSNYKLNSSETIDVISKNTQLREFFNEEFIENEQAKIFSFSHDSGIVDIITGAENISDGKNITEALLQDLEKKVRIDDLITNFINKIQ
jgi:hypothetical protein